MLLASILELLKPTCYIAAVLHSLQQLDALLTCLARLTVLLPVVQHNMSRLDGA